MPRRVYIFYHSMVPYLRIIRSSKFYFIVICTTLTTFLIGAQFVLKQNPSDIRLPNFRQDFWYTNAHTKQLRPNLKYILLWTRRDYAPFSFLKDGQKSFLNNNCSFVNCYVTANKKLFPKLTKYDAIAFNGRNMNPNNLPFIRNPRQKYIFFNMESSDNYPVCDAIFDGFFNLTATYKLNSDIPIPYILIRNMKGEIVGPKINMQWESAVKMDLVGDMRGNKTKVVAWFSSNCNTRSKREDFVKRLSDALMPFDYEVDMFGGCGTLKCPRSKKADCDLLLKNKYFFYLSLENSYSEDYVTEKVLTALNHNVVPIVLGGANYSRFLPPGSYIDGTKYSNNSIYDLGLKLYEIVYSPLQYNNFFHWKKYYTYHDPIVVENICKICEVLNNENLMQKSTVYDDFRAWWNPNYKYRCNKKKKSIGPH